MMGSPDLGRGPQGYGLAHRGVRDIAWPSMDGMERLRRERHLYLRLLELEHQRGTSGLLEECLQLAVEATGARVGYIELRPIEALEGPPKWSCSFNCSPTEVDEIASVTSRSIVAAAMTSGQVIHTPFAILDARFSEKDSVRSQRLEAVLCVPLGERVTSGVLYLEGRRGAGPFLPEDVQLAETFARHVSPILERIARTAERDPLEPLRAKLAELGIVGGGRAMTKVFHQVQLASPLDVTVLITGPTGAGKTQIAHAIHAQSPRSIGPFVALNCAAIPDHLYESELFGTMEGAFTGALTKAGKVQAAENGTLFLDEIGEIPLELQAKILQLLQSRTYYPVGGTKLHTSNARIIAATNHDLKELIRAKKFREDLYYRLNVLSIVLPSLEARREDVVPLAEHFTRTASTRHSLPPLALTPSACATLETADWPGQVRQLSNVVETGLIRAAAEGARAIEPRHLFPESQGEDEPTAGALTFHEATRRYQRAFLVEALDANDWNVVETARRIDISRAQIYNLMRLYGLQRRGR